MKSPRRALAVVAAMAAAVVLLTGCSSGGGGSSSSGSNSNASFNAATASVVNPSTKTGGTLNLVASADCDSWDPAITYYGWCWNMQRTITRTLVGYSTVDGSNFKLAPDLATSLGTHNSNYTEWTFTLKSGLKWSDGKAITPMDVKYGIERLFASQVTGGGPGFYLTTGLIAGTSKYGGPYTTGATAGDTTGDLPASSISTTSDSITFHLSESYADFDYLMALDAAAPVPYQTEGGTGYTGTKYTLHPMSSGPYEIKSYTQNQKMVLVRNPYWKQSSDTIRHPLASQIDLTIDTSSTDIANKLKSGVYDAMANTDVPPAFQSQILANPTLKADADDPAGDSSYYFSIAPSVIPNQWCRAAVMQATNKESLLQAYGGGAAGTVANSMTPPGIPGYDATSNVWSTGKNNTGDLTAAKQDLQKCGKPSGFSTKFAYSTASQVGPAVFQAEQTALARVGIKITPATADGSVYYKSFLGSPSTVKSQGLGIGMAGWGADFTTGYGYWQNIANGNAIAPTGNSNYPSLNDPVVNKILDSSLAGTTTTAQWKQLDTQVMKDSVYLPIAFEKNLYYRNPRLTNVTSNNAQAFGIYDFVNVGVGG